MLLGFIGKLEGKVYLTCHKTGLKFIPRRSTISESIVLQIWSSFIPFRFTPFWSLLYSLKITVGSILNNVSIFSTDLLKI